MKGYYLKLKLLIQQYILRTAPIIKPTGKVHDITKMKHWGYNCYFINWEARKLVGWHPNRFSFREGDEIREKMQSGLIGRFLITDVTYENGVDDMFSLKVQDIGYYKE